MECSGVSNLSRPYQPGLQERLGSQYVHRSPIMRTQKPHPFLRDLGQLEQRNHLETFFGDVS